MNNIEVEAQYDEIPDHLVEQVGKIFDWSNYTIYEPHARDSRVEESGKILKKRLQKAAMGAAAMQEAETGGDKAGSVEYSAAYKWMKDKYDNTIIEEGAVAGVPFSLCHMKGPRPTQEDRHICGELVVGTEHCPVGAVLDGHGGEICAEYMSKNLLSHIQARVMEFMATQFEDGGYDMVMYNALKCGFADAQSSFIDVEKKREEEGKSTRLSWPRNSDVGSGTTVTLACVVDGNVWCANCGDSRSILVQSSRVVALSTDAKPEMPYIKKSIEKRGGTVTGDMLGGVLMVGRALGDTNLAGINPRPKITKVECGKKDGGMGVLVLACDGLWDVTTSADVGTFIQNKCLPGSEKPGIAGRSRELCAFALEKESFDNISVLLLDLTL